MGAWQAGCVEALTKGGLVFDKILGFSAGGLTGAGYTFGFQDELLRRWRNTNEQPLLRFSPSMKPFSLFSGQGIWDAVRLLEDEPAMKAAARCELTVMSHRVADGATVYSRFSPKGERGWDGPLPGRLAAGCAIPWIYPPVTLDEAGAPVTYIDGGIPGRDWMKFDALEGCKDVIVVEMVRPEEPGRRTYTPVAYYEQLGRETCRRQIDSGVASASRWAAPPRIFRLPPSRRLTFTMLDFTQSVCVEAVEHGLRDGATFLASPREFAKI